MVICGHALGAGVCLPCIVSMVSCGSYHSIQEKRGDQSDPKGHKRGLWWNPGDLLLHLRHIIICNPLPVYEMINLSESPFLSDVFAD